MTSTNNGPTPGTGILCGVSVPNLSGDLTSHYISTVVYSINNLL